LQSVAFVVVKGIAGVELNLACPNIPGKPIIAYDFDEMEAVLSAVTKSPAFKKMKIPLGVKLAPYFDMPHFKKVCESSGRRVESLS